MNLQRIANRLKKICKLSPTHTLLIAIPSYLFVIWLLLNERENELISYVVYALSAYALMITITGTVDAVRRIRINLDNHPVVKRYLEEKEFRTELSLCMGLAINIVYAVVKFFSGIYYNSFWFGAFAVYYFLLAVSGKNH